MIKFPLFFFSINTHPHSLLLNQDTSILDSSFSPFTHPPTSKQNHPIMRFTSLSVGAFIVASILVLSPVAVDATRCKCTSNGFNSESSYGIDCCNQLHGTVMKNIVGNFLGCDSDSLGGTSGENYQKFDTCCKGKNSNYYRGCSII